jgi:hypothetical protein
MRKRTRIATQSCAPHGIEVVVRAVEQHAHALQRRDVRMHLLAAQHRA